MSEETTGPKPERVIPWQGPLSGNTAALRSERAELRLKCLQSAVQLAVASHPEIATPAAR